MKKCIKRWSKKLKQEKSNKIKTEVHPSVFLLILENHIDKFRPSNDILP